MKTLLVTGIHGFVAGEVARAAHARGVRIVGVGRAAAAPAAACNTYLRADCAVDDLAPLIATARPDAIFHGAGTGSVAGSYANPRADFDASVVSFARVLDAVRQSAPSAVVVFPSSASVYGVPDTLPVRESSRTSPVSPYGFHKAVCETLAREYSECFGVRTTCLRIFSTFGVRQKKLLVWELAQQALGPGSEVVLVGTGEEERDYLHAEDVAHAGLALAAMDTPPLIVNVASGLSLTTREVAEAVVRGTGVDKPIRCLGNARRGDPPVWRADVARLREVVTLPPRPAAEALAEVVRTWARNPPV